MHSRSASRPHACLTPPSRPATLFMPPVYTPPMKWPLLLGLLLLAAPALLWEAEGSGHPVIVVTGYTIHYHHHSFAYTDAGAVCTHANGTTEDLTAPVPPGSEMGGYLATLTYTCTSKNGMTATAERLVSNRPLPAMDDRPYLEIDFPNLPGLKHPLGVPFEIPTATCRDTVNGVISNYTVAILGSDPGSSVLREFESLATVPEGLYLVSYECTDQAGQHSGDRRNVRQFTVVLDEERPRMEPPAARVGVFHPAENYTEPGVECEDKIDMVVDKRIGGDEVDSESTGEYTVEYTCTDRTGNVARASTAVAVYVEEGLYAWHADSEEDACTQVRGESRETLVRPWTQYTELAGGTVAMRLWLDGGGLEVESKSYPGHTGSVSHVEVRAVSTGLALAIYNYTLEDDTITASVPPEALRTITGDVENEFFQVSTVNATAISGDTLVRRIANPSVGAEEYAAFPSATVDALLEPDGEPVLVGARGGAPSLPPGSAAAHGSCWSAEALLAPDITPPEVDITGFDIAVVHNGVYEELGAVCRDDLDEDEPATVDGIIDTSVFGEQSVRYDCTDSAGNDPGPSFRKVTIVPRDAIGPTVVANGFEFHFYDINEPYVEMGATCTDRTDGRIFDIDIEGHVDTSIRNSRFAVTYTCTDSSGNVGTAVRRVFVTLNRPDSTPPDIIIHDVPAWHILYHPPGTPFEPPLATCYDSWNRRISNYTVTHDVDVNNRGGYYAVTYDCVDQAGNKASDRSGSHFRTLYVLVQPDTRPPTAHVLGPNPQKVTLRGEYVEHGVRCEDLPNDDFAGRASGRVDTGTRGLYTITYTCTDGAGLTDTATRVVNVTPPDAFPPLLRLVGNSTVRHEYGESYIDDGAICIDDVDGVIRPGESGIVDIYETGAYRITYTCTDTSDNEAPPIVRTVNVVRTDVLPAGLHDATTTICTGHSRSASSATWTEDGLLVSMDVSGLPEAAQSAITVLEVADSLGHAVLVYNYTISDGTLSALVPNATAVLLEAGEYRALAVRDIIVGRDVNFANTIPFRYVRDQDVSFEQYRRASSVSYPFVSASFPVELPDRIAVVFELGINPSQYNALGRPYSCIVASDSAAPPPSGPPVIMINGGDDVSLMQGTVYIELDATCADSGGAPLPVSMRGMIDTSMVGMQFVEYSCTDTAGAKTAKNRTVTVSADAVQSKPVILHSGSLYVEVRQFDRYEDPRPRCLEVTRLLRADIEFALNGTAVPFVDTAISGNYTVTYTCTGSGGDADPVVRRVVVLDGTRPAIVLDERRTRIPTGGSFAVPEATCTDNIDPDKPADAALFIGTVPPRLVGSVDTGRIVPHHVEYTCTDSAGNPSDPLVLSIQIYDADMPVISLLGANPQRIILGDPYTELGATCNDMIDGMIDPVVNSSRVDEDLVGEYEVIYECADDEGNMAIPGMRQVNIVPPDTMPPVITVTGRNVTIPGNSTYVDEGAICMDEFDGTAGPAEADNPVDTSVAGPYLVRYDCEDVAGNEAIPRFRSVLVADGRFPFITLNGDERVRIPRNATFDDPLARCVDDGIDLPVMFESGLDVTMLGTYRIDYWCEDPAGIRASTHRNVTVYAEFYFDIGARSVVLRTGDDYEDPGAVCTFDGDPIRVTNGTYLASGAAVDAISTASARAYLVVFECGHPESGQVHRLDRRVTVEAPPRSDDWHADPTFGIDWETGEPAVSRGFGLDGRTVDVLDNFHAEFSGAAEVGTPSTARLKIHSEFTLEEAAVHLGVPDLSRVTDAESSIAVLLARNYTAPGGHEVAGIYHLQGVPLADPGATSARVLGEECRPGSGVQCTVVEVTFTVLMAPAHRMMAISAMDVERRYTVTYVNSGVEFAGDPLLPPENATLVIRRGNQHPAETVVLERDGPRSSTWTDQHGRSWTTNEYGSWEMAHVAHERGEDPEVTVMTRLHTGFAGLVLEARERAALVFNSSELLSPPAPPPGDGWPPGRAGHARDLPPGVVLESMRVADLRGILPLNGSSGPP